MNETDLWVEYRKSGSDRTFRELVRRYTNLVYSVAKRRIGRDILAQEATQLVFIKLARTAPHLPSDAALASWLHRTAVSTSIDLWRSESRRRAREEHAVAMQPTTASPAPWEELRPVLDEALNELSEPDRHAILLRFFRTQSMRELGEIFGISEDAAKMRVSRALERLRRCLSARGVTLTATMLASLLQDHAVHAAPAPLSAALESMTYPSPEALGIGATLLAWFVSMTPVKTACLVAAFAAALSSPWIIPHLKHDPPPLHTASVGEIHTASVEAGPGSPENILPSDNHSLGEPHNKEGALEEDPDPRKLLRNVAAARLELTSGSVEFFITSDFYRDGNLETNHVNLHILFEDHKLRCEQSDRQFRYTATGSEASQALAEHIKARNLDRQTAVQEGLLEGFTAHAVSIYDGLAIMQYRKHGDQQGSTVIDDPKGGTTQYVFNPRCLGLATVTYALTTVEGCLGMANAKSIKLLGEEPINGVPAWHVQVISSNDYVREFWIDIDRPTRVLCQKDNSRVAMSYYDPVDQENPLPHKVVVSRYRHGALQSVQQFHRMSTKFNPPIDESTWTLAGLNMPVGTAVTDVRISRSLGYWTGTGLTKFPPSKKPTPLENPLTLTKALHAMDQDPTTDSAYESAKWIHLNTPDGPEVEQAAQVLLQYHTHRSGLAKFCEEQERVRHRSSTGLLEAILFNNANQDVRAAACFNLAILLKTEADYGQNPEATQEAIHRFEQVIAEFGSLADRGGNLIYQSKKHLVDLKQMFVGHPAPELAGTDFSGNPIKLKDYEGQVVMVYFYSHSFNDVGSHRNLLQRLKGEPFTLLAVNCDGNRTNAMKFIEERNITWPVIEDGLRGPIASAWNISRWPETFLLDRRGIIRYREVRGRALNEAVDQLLNE